MYIVQNAFLMLYCYRADSKEVPAQASMLLSAYRLKDLLTQRLLEAGWIDSVKERMRGT